MASYNNRVVPSDEQPIEVRDGKFLIPDNPIILFIEGDGTGPDIWRASRAVLDAAVARAYGGRRKFVWYEVLAGEKAFRESKSWLPQDTLDAIRQKRVTYDLHRLMDGAVKLKTSEFSAAIVENMNAAAAA